MGLYMFQSILNCTLYIYVVLNVNHTSIGIKSINQSHTTSELNESLSYT